MNDQQYNCRFYEQELPEVGDNVIVRIDSIVEMGVYVTLLQYNLEGLIQLSELSKRKIRSISKIVYIGKIEVATVLRVDHEKKYIDLSKKRVDPEEIEEAVTKYNKEKIVNGIIRHVLIELSKPSMYEELMKTIVWPLVNQYGNAYDAFQLSANNSSILLSLELESEDVLKTLITFVSERFSPQPLTIRAEIAVRCNTEHGIDAIIAALRHGKIDGVDIKFISSPMYLLQTEHIHEQVGIELLNTSIQLIERKIKEFGGWINVKQAPYIVDQLKQSPLDDVEKIVIDADNDESSSDE